MQINVTNGTISQVSQTLTPASGQTLPANIIVNGSSYTYNASTGVLTLTNLTDTTYFGLPAVASFNDINVVEHDTYITLTVNGVSVDININTLGPVGYSGSITNNHTTGTDPAANIYIKFGQAPNSANDWDYATNGTLLSYSNNGNSSHTFSNELTAYVWKSASGAAYATYNSTTIYPGQGYSNATLVNLVTNGNIALNSVIYDSTVHPPQPKQYYHITVDCEPSDGSLGTADAVPSQIAIDATGPDNIVTLTAYENGGYFFRWIIPEDYEIADGGSIDDQCLNIIPHSDIHATASFTAEKDDYIIM